MSQLAVAGLALKAFIGPRLRRWRLVAILAVAAFAFAIPALGFLGLAGFHALADRMSATDAAIVVGGIMLVVAALLALAAALVARRAPSSIGAAMLDPGAMVAPLRAGIRANPGTSTTTAAVLGLLVGFILPMLRRP